MENIEGPGHRWKIRQVPLHYNAIAKDGSEIRQIFQTEEASLVHCTLRPPTVTSVATRNLGINEIWYFIDGRGQIWLKGETGETEKEIGPSTCLSIPAGVHFQFRNTGEEPLTFLCITMPPWPGEHANVVVEEAHWEST
jgi:mannose-6-phosphate isomerase-like protein (cupin superfamily)